MENQVKELIVEFFEKLNVDIDSIEVNKEEEWNIFNVKIKTSDSWVLIWQHGRNLDAIQNILKLITSKKIWDRAKLHIEVNDYMKSKDERLFDFIKSKIEIVERTWNDIKLPFYSSYERKKIHGFVHSLDKKSIYTKSIWEKKDRRLHICKQEQKLSIDIDWDDI